MNPKKLVLVLFSSCTLITITNAQTTSIKERAKILKDKPNWSLMTHQYNEGINYSEEVLNKTSMNSEGLVCVAIALDDLASEPSVLILAFEYVELWYVGETTANAIGGYGLENKHWVGTVPGRKLAFPIDATKEFLLLKVSRELSSRSFHIRDHFTLIAIQDFQTDQGLEHAFIFVVVGIVFISLILNLLLAHYLKNKAYKSFSYFNLAVIVLFLHLEDYFRTIWPSLAWIEWSYLLGDYVLTFIVWALFTSFTQQYLKLKQAKKSHILLIVIKWILFLRKCLALSITLHILGKLFFDPLESAITLDEIIPFLFYGILFIITLLVLLIATVAPFFNTNRKTYQYDNAKIYAFSTWILGAGALCHILKLFGIIILDGIIQPIDIAIAIHPGIFVMGVVRNFYSVQKHRIKIYRDLLIKSRSLDLYLKEVNNLRKENSLFDLIKLIISQKKDQKEEQIQSKDLQLLEIYIETVLLLMEKGIDPRIGEIAELTNLGERTLARRINQMTNLTPKSLIRLLKLIKAIEYLDQGMIISKVAKKICVTKGHFYKFFIEMTGKSPQRFRKKYLQVRVSKAPDLIQNFEIEHIDKYKKTKIRISKVGPWITLAVENPDKK